jgi:hypothetical protein
MVVVYTDPKLEINWLKKKNSNMLNLQFIDQNDTKASKTDQYTLWIYRHQVDRLRWTEHDGLNYAGGVEHQHFS